jgi:hypothetical protein
MQHAINNLMKLEDVLSRTADTIKISTDPIETYFSLCIKRIQKVIPGLEALFPMVEQNINIEYSVGLLLRPVLTDILSLEYLLHFLNNRSEGIDKIEFTKTHCKSYIFDGTYKWIEQIDMDLEKGVIDSSMHKQMTEKIATYFPDLFTKNETGEFFFVKGSYRAKQPKELYQNMKNLDQDRATVMSKIYYIFNFYSKYEHLSGWTQIASHYDADAKKEHIEEVTVHMIRYVVQVFNILENIHPELKYEKEQLDTYLLQFLAST